MANQTILTSQVWRASLVFLEIYVVISNSCLVSWTTSSKLVSNLFILFEKCLEYPSLDFASHARNHLSLWVVSFSCYCSLADEVTFHKELQENYVMHSFVAFPTLYLFSRRHSF